MVSRKEKALTPFYIIAALLLPLLLLPKGTIVLFLNHRHNSFLDIFFKVASSLGNGSSIALCAIPVLLFMKRKWFYRFLIATALHFSFVHLFKQVLFRSMKRPASFFDEATLSQLHFVEGIKVHHLHSFPSGHTATIFFLVSFLALFAANKKQTYLLALVGLAVGASRMYLMQHFFIDVFFGMCFGVLSTVLAHRIIRSYYKSSYEKRFFPTLYTSFRQQLSLRFNL